MNQPNTFLYDHTAYKWDPGASRPQYTTTKIYSGTPYPLAVLFAGTRIVFEGRFGVISGGQKNKIVRFEDNGMPERLSADTLVIPASRDHDWTKWGLPMPGDFVRVLAGPEQGRIGVVTNPGTNSTYVNFLEGTTPEKFKVKARELQIVQVAVQVLTPAP